MRVTSKGQVTIPVAIREALGLLPDTEVEFTMEGDKAILRKARRSAKGMGRGRRIVEQLRGKGTVRMSTDEIMALMRGR